MTGDQIIAITALVGSLVFSAITVGFSWKARTAGMRSQLFDRQFEYIVRMHRMCHELYLLARQLPENDDDKDTERLISEIAKVNFALLNLGFESLLVLPRGQLVTIYDVHHRVGTVLIQARQNKVTDFHVDSLDSAIGDVTAEWRSFLGAERLTKENLSALGKKLDRASEMANDTPED